MSKYYDAIAEGYDELHGKEQKEKIKFIKSLVNLPKDAKLLDVGCGTGISTVAWENATGVDPSTELIKIAKSNYKNTKFIKAPAEKLPFDDNSFAVITSFTAIQNFEDIKQGLKEIKRVGNNIFILTYLKGVRKSKEIEKNIENLWPSARRYDQRKDIIFIII